MGVHIDRNKCIGCGKCKSICPGNIIDIDYDDKALLKKPVNCWSCSSCIKECPVSAISLALTPEMDGRGAILVVSKSNKDIKWRIIRENEELATFVTNPDEANKY